MKYKLLVPLVAVCLLVGVLATNLFAGDYPITSTGDIVRYLNLVKTRVDSLEANYESGDSLTVKGLDSLMVWCTNLDTKLDTLDDHMVSKATWISTVDAKLDSLTDHVVDLNVAVAALIANFNAHVNEDSCHVYLIGATGDSVGDATAIAQTDTLTTAEGTIVAFDSIAVGVVAVPYDSVGNVGVPDSAVVLDSRGVKLIGGPALPTPK